MGAPIWIRHSASKQRELRRELDRLDKCDRSEKLHLHRLERAGPWELHGQLRIRERRHTREHNRDSAVHQVADLDYHHLGHDNSSDHSSDLGHDHAPDNFAHDHGRRISERRNVHPPPAPWLEPPIRAPPLLIRGQHDMQFRNTEPGVAAPGRAVPQVIQHRGRKRLLAEALRLMLRHLLRAAHHVRAAPQPQRGLEPDRRAELFRSIQFDRRKLQGGRRTYELRPVERHLLQLIDDLSRERILREGGFGVLYGQRTPAASELMLWN